MIHDFKKNIGFFIIIFHFILEFSINLFLKIGFDTNPGNTKIVFFKILIFVGLLFFSLVNFKFYINQLLALLFISLTAFVGWFAYHQKINTNEFYVFVKTIARYIYPFLWLFFFSKLSKKQLERSLFGFRLILLVNTILILIGLLCSIDLLKSYSNRFGYNGVFYLANDASAFYFLGLAVLYPRVQRENNIWNVYEFIFALVGSVLLGTKTAYLFLCIFSAFYVYNSKKYFTGVLIVFIIVILLYVTGMSSFFIELSEEKNVLFSLSSGRSELFVDKIIPLIESWEFINYLFGGSNYLRNYVQMDIVDLFIFFGIIGGSVYLFMFFKEFFYDPNNNYLFFVGISYLFLGALAGHYYPSGVVSIYLALISIILKKYNIESCFSTRLVNRIRRC